MTDLTSEEQELVALYRTVFLALHLHDQELDESRSMFVSVMRLAAMLKSDDGRVRAKAGQVMTYLETARQVAT